MMASKVKSAGSIFLDHVEPGRPTKRSAKVLSVDEKPFFDSACVSVSLRCPKCSGTGTMIHPIGAAVAGLAELPDADLDSVLSEHGKKVAKGGIPVEYIKCPLCGGAKDIQGQASLLELLEEFCRPKGEA